MKIRASGKFNIEWFICLYIIAALIFLCFFIAFSPNKYVFDERDFMPNVAVLSKYGYSFDFLRNIKGQSPGPLYQFIYYPISYIIPLTPHNIRFVNLFILLCDLYLLYLLLRIELKKHALLITLLFISIPMTWNVTGMAITELPSIFFCFLSLLLLKKSFLVQYNASIYLSFFAGLAAGLATIGRTPFLMILPASLVLYKFSGRNIQTTIFLIAGIIFPAIVYYAWQGLVPPDVQNIQSGYSIPCLFLCITYFAITVLIIYPELFRIERKHYYLAFLITILSVGANVFIFKIKYLPMHSVVTSKFIPQSIYSLYPYLFEALTVGCSYLFTISMYIHVKTNKPGLWDLFLLTITMLIILTTIKSAAHFSSRYVMQAFPFFLLYIANSIRINKYLLLRVIVGTIIGLASLHSYYIVQHPV